MFGESVCNCLKIQENKGFWSDWDKLNAADVVMDQWILNNVR